MTFRHTSTAIIQIICLAAIFSTPTYGQYAVQVTSYDQGSTPAEILGSDPPAFFNQQAAALGSPERITGEGGNYPGAVTPFNSPFLPNEIVSVGEDGHLTLRLSNFAIPQPDGPEIGVFTNSAIFDVDFPNGVAGDPIAQFSVDSAEVDVSEDGMTWIALGEILFQGISNGFNDVAQTVLSDFQLPFTDPIESLAGLNYSDGSGDDILSRLDGSGGGTWIDISSTGLDQVGFVRFRVSDDNDDATSLNFELDALSIASSAVGTATPEPTGICLVVFAAIALVFLRPMRFKSDAS